MTLIFSSQSLLTTSIVIILRHSYHHLFFQHVYILRFNSQHHHSVSATRKLASFRNVKFKQFLTQYLFFLVISVRILFYISELPVSILHNLLSHTYKAHFTCHLSFYPVKTSNNKTSTNFFPISSSLLHQEIKQIKLIHRII